jgi:hypothetical protein
MVDMKGDGTLYEIWGRFVAWNGSYFWPEIRIAAAADRTFWHPRVVHNSTRNVFLVAWTSYATGVGPYSQVGSIQVEPDGTLGPKQVLTTSTHPEQADVAYNSVTDEYFVVFRRSNSPSTTGQDVYGLRVTADNAVIPSSLVPIATTSKHEHSPRVAVDGQGNVVTLWVSQYSTSDNDIYGQKLDQHGSLVGTVFAIATSANDETDPDIAATTGASYLAVWQHYDTSGRSIKAVGRGEGQVPHFFDVATAGASMNLLPSVTANAGQYLIAYEKVFYSDPGMPRKIYARRWTPRATFLPLLQR